MDDRTRRRGSLRFWLIALGLTALVPAGYVAFLRPPEVEPPAPSATPPPPDAGAEPLDAGAGPEDLTVTEVTGTVEIRKGRVAAYEPARPGAVLAAEDGLRTGAGRAVLTARGAFEVQVEPGTVLGIDALDERRSRLALGAGMVVATVEGGAEHRLHVTAERSGAEAVASRGRFAMSNNGRGTVAVGARDGEVEFSAAGKAVVLRAGQQSIARGGAPEAPTAIPGTLFLKVSWPAEATLNRAAITLTGRTAPGAVLLLEGVPVRVEKDGRFTAAVRLREGRNVLRAESVDVGGRRADDRAELEVDTLAPESEIRTQGLWGDPPDGGGR